MTFSDEVATSLLLVVPDRLTDLNKTRKGALYARPTMYIDDIRNNIASVL